MDDLNKRNIYLTIQQSLSAISNDKITSELGWQPSLTFEEGIKLTIDWYLNNQDWMKNIENKKVGLNV